MRLRTCGFNQIEFLDRYTRDVFQCFAAKPFADLGQCGFLRISEPQPSRQMCSQDKVLGGQVFVLQQQFLV